MGNDFRQLDADVARAQGRAVSGPPSRAQSDHRPVLVLGIIGAQLVAVLVCALVQVATLGLDRPWDAAVAHEPGQLAALALRVGWLVLATSLQARGSARLLLALGLVASLAWRAMFLPFVGIALAVSLLGVRRAPCPRSQQHFLLVVTVVLCGMALWKAPAHAAPTPVVPTNVVDATTMLLERGNLLRARHAASVWCDSEPIPGQGCLLLARICLFAHDQRAARQVATRLLAKRCRVEHRVAARKLLQQLGGER